MVFSGWLRWTWRRFCYGYFGFEFSMVMPLSIVLVSEYLVSEDRISILKLNFKCVMKILSFAAFFDDYGVLLAFLSQ